MFPNLAEQKRGSRAETWIGGWKIAAGEEYWAPLRFWTLFAAAHPLLQPAVGLGEARGNRSGFRISATYLKFLIV